MKNETPPTLRSGHFLPNFLGSGIPPKRNSLLKTKVLRSGHFAKRDKIAVIFGKPSTIIDPLNAMGEKKPVYLEFLKICKNEGMEPFITTKNAYLGQGSFSGFWPIFGQKEEYVNKKIDINLGYDRSGGIDFPREKDSFRVVDNLDFKLLAWNKWEAYKLLSKYMAKSYLVEGKEDLFKVSNAITTPNLVVKPVNGLKGKGIYVGDRDGLKDFPFDFTNSPYIASEFVETEKGIPGIIRGRHDLRVVIVNGKIVWSHVRAPKDNGYLANVAGGGTLSEVEVDSLPYEVKKISLEIAKNFIERYDNPIYSLDFGIETSGTPVIFEINDQIGFPKLEMKAKDFFLSELAQNFKSKLN